MISAVMNGNSTSITSFNRNVGIGSSDDDLDGDAMITRRTSASVTGWKTSIDVTAVARTSGGGEPSVAALVHICYAWSLAVTV